MKNIKKCKLCEEIKLTSEFALKKGGKDGLNAKCRQCVAQLERESRAKNPTIRREAERKYRLKNIEKINATARDLYKKKPEKAREKHHKKITLLSGAYIKERLRLQAGIPSHEIPDFLVKAKASHLHMRRVILGSRKND